MTAAPRPDAVRRCPLTYVPLEEGRYSRKGLRHLAAGLKDLSVGLTTAQLLEEAAARSPKMSIQGVQPKVSAMLDVKQGRFVPVDVGGTYILKPQVPSYRQVPENEDLTMRLGALAGLDVPPHGLVYTDDGALCYFVARFDRTPTGKRAMEDFAQLLGRARETKYDSSMERVAGVLERYCTNPVREKARLLRYTLVAFLTGNEDAHLKNFSLVTDGPIVQLSPAYDLVNTTLLLDGATEELALPLNGRKRALTRAMLLKYFARERMGLSARIVEQIERELQAILPVWDELITHSFLTPERQQRYRALVQERSARLFTRPAE